MGGNSTVAITFDDLYLADVAGGWGQVLKQGNNQYIFYCFLDVGNGSTTVFRDYDKQVFFNDTILTANSQHIIEVLTGASFTLGAVLNSTQYLTYKGCDIYCTSIPYYGSLIAANGGSVYIYGGTCGSVETGSQDMMIRQVSGSVRIWNTYLADTSVPPYGVTDIYGATLKSLFYPPANSIINKIKLMDGDRAIRFLADNVTIKDSEYARSSGRWMVHFDGATNNLYYLVNMQSNWWVFRWVGTTGTGRVYRQYEYDLTVLNGEITDFVENANVTLTKSGVQIGTWLTNSSGQISTQTVTYGFYNCTGGNIMYDGADPFVLTVTHPDWADYESRFYVTEKTKMTISMQDTTTANNAALIWSMLFGTLAFALFLAWRVRR